MDIPAERMQDVKDDLEFASAILDDILVDRTGHHARPLSTQIVQAGLYSVRHRVRQVLESIVAQVG